MKSVCKLRTVFSPGFCLGECQGRALLLRNRGPVRTLRGQRVNLAHTPNNDLFHEVPTCSNMTYDWCLRLITMRAPVFTMYVGPMKVEEMELKTSFNFDVSCFLFIQPSKILWF